MAKSRELLVTLGADTTTFSQKVKRAKDLTKELDANFKLLSSSSRNFENTIDGVAQKQQYLSDRIKVANDLNDTYNNRLKEQQTCLNNAKVQFDKVSRQVKSSEKALEKFKNELTQSNTELQKSESKLQQAKNNLNQLEQELKDLKDCQENSIDKEEWNAWQQEIDKTENSIKQLKDKLSLLEDSQDKATNKAEWYAYQQQIDKTKNEINQLELELKDLKDCQDAVVHTQEWNDWQKEIDQTEQKIKDTNNTIQDSENEIQLTNKKIQGLNNNIKKEEQHLEKLNKQWEASRKDVRLFTDSVISVNTAIDKNQTELQKMNAELVETKVKLTMLNRDNTFKALSTEISEADRKFTNAKNSVATFGNSMAHLTMQEEHLNTQLQKTKTLMNEYQVDIKQSTNEVKRLETESEKLIKDVRRYEQAVNSMDGTEDNYRAIADELDRLRTELTTTNRLMELHRQRVESLTKSYKQSENNLNQMEGELKQVKNQLRQVGNKNSFTSLERAVESARHSFELLESKLEVVRSSFMNFENSLKGARQESKLLKQQTEALRNEYQQQTNLISAYESKLESLENEYKQLKNDINTTKTAMSNMQKGSDDWNKAILKLGELEDSFEQVDNEIDQVRNSLRQAQVQANNTLSRINTNIQSQQRMWSVLANNIRTVGMTMTSIGGGLQSIGGALMPLTAGVTALGAGIISTGASFEQSMSKVQALFGASKEDLQKLTDKARELGKETIYSATEASEGLQYLALAGYDAQDAMDSLPIILEGCMAGSMELGTGSDLATDALGSLGKNAELTGDKVKDLEILLNQTAKTSTKSNSSMEQLLNAYIKVGGQIETMNIPLSTANTMLGILADRGIKGEQAGNSLNSILINLTKSTGESAKGMKKLGVSAFDAKGKMRPIEDILGDMKAKLDDLGLEEGNENAVQILNMIGGKTQAKTLQKLLQGIDADTKQFTDHYKNMKREVEKAVELDSLKKMAEQMTDNLSSDFRIMKSQLQEMFLSIFMDLSPKLRKLVQSVTDVIGKLTENDVIKNVFSDIIDLVQKLVDKFDSLSPSMQENIIKFTILAGIFAPLITFLGMFISGIGSVISVFGTLVGGVGKVIGKFALLKESGTGLSGFLSGKFGGVISKITGLFSGGLSGALTTIATSVLPVLGEAFVVFSAILGDNVNVLDWLMDKFGALGTALSGLAEFINGVFTGTAGQVFTVLKAIGKSTMAIMKGDLGSLDDIWSQTWSQLQNNATQAWNNITIDSTRAISTLKTYTSEDVKEIGEIFKNTFDEVSNVTTSTVGDVSENLTKMFADSNNKTLNLSQSTIDILSGTSETMRILFADIKGDMDITEAQEQFKNNLYNLVNSGQYSSEQIEEDFKNAWSIINSNIIDGGETIKRNAEDVLTDFGEIASGRIDAGAENIAESLSQLGMKGVESLRGIGTNWNTIFQGISEDGATSTEEMKEAILNNLDKLGLNTPEKLQAFKETLRDELNTASAETQQNGLEIGTNLTEGIETGISEGTESATATAENAGQELGESATTGAEQGFSQLPDSVKEQLEQAGVSINEQGNVIVEDMAEKGKEGAKAYVDEMNSNLPALSNVSSTIQSQLKDINSVRFGGVTKQLSEINKWLDRVNKSSNGTKTALTNVKTISFGTTTKGLSEVNKWLGKDKTSATAVRKSLLDVKAVTFGTTTKGLSEVNKWLGKVKTSGKTAKATLSSIASVRFGGVTSSLSAVVSWLDKVRSKASNAKSAISSVSTAKAKVVNAQALSLEQTADITPVPEVATLSDYSASIMSKSVDLNNYKTSGGFYAVQDIMKASSEINNSETMQQKSLIEALLNQNKLLTQLLAKDNSINITLDADGRQLARVSAKYMDEEIKKITNRKQRIGGITQYGL